MGFVSCLEDQQKRFESDCHLLQKNGWSGNVDGEHAKKEALRLLGDARVYWAQILDYLGELTEPGLAEGQSLKELRVLCSELENTAARAESRMSCLVGMVRLLAIQNQILQERVRQERRQRKKLERDFERIGQEDFGRLVEPFLTTEMFKRHAR